MDFKLLNTKWLPGLILVIFLCVSSCYPGESVFDVGDLDIVLTLRDQDFNFSQNQTYSMPDSIAVLGGRFLLTNDFDQAILDRIDQNMQQLGYSRIDNPDENNQPDLILLVSKIATENIEAYQSDPLWWDYWGWYPGWGYYPPGFGAALEDVAPVSWPQLQLPRVILPEG